MRPIEPGSRWRFAAGVAAGALPGLLAGTQAAGLLFFLNPHLPFEPRLVLEAILFYGALLGGVSLLLLLPLTHARWRGLRRVLPVALTVVMAASGLGFWAHAYFYSLYLPPGINRRLLKAALWLSLAALVCFYTVLLHRWRQRPYGRRTLLLFVVLSIASISVVVERREAFRPSPEPVPRATTFAGTGRPTLAVVAVDSATLDAILPLAEQGRLPFFAQMRAGGTRMRLRSLQPARDVALWTTVATGKPPYVHAIVDDRVHPATFSLAGHDLRLLPLAVGFESWGVWGASRAVDTRDLRALPLWRILDRLGLETVTVGWPVTTPAGPSTGTRPIEPGDPASASSPAGDVVVSDRFFSGGDAIDSIHPPSLAARARVFAPVEIDPVDAERFGPSPPAAVFESLAGDRWRSDLAYFLLEREPGADAVFLHLPGLRSVAASSHGGWSASLRGGIDETTREAERLTVAYYRHLDETLAQFWDAMPEPRLLVVVSAAGVREPTAAERLFRDARAGRFDDRPDGFAMFYGNGIEAGRDLRRAQLVDLVPTILYSLGYPVARDLGGSVLTEAFERPFLASHSLTFVPSYETFSPVE